jgi:hypothetical protein
LYKSIHQFGVNFASLYWEQPLTGIPAKAAAQVTTTANWIRGNVAFHDEPTAHVDASDPLLSIVIIVLSSGLLPLAISVGLNVCTRRGLCDNTDSQGDEVTVIGRDEVKAND